MLGCMVENTSRIRDFKGCFFSLKLVLVRVGGTDGGTSLLFKLAYRSDQCGPACLIPDASICR
jgi:hypothetical protein